MVEFTLCPFCKQETRKIKIKTETHQDVSTHNGKKQLIYYSCENCAKVWIEFTE